MVDWFFPEQTHVFCVLIRGDMSNFIFDAKLKLCHISLCKYTPRLKCGDLRENQSTLLPLFFFQFPLEKKFPNGMSNFDFEVRQMRHTHGMIAAHSELFWKNPLSELVPLGGCYSMFWKKIHIQIFSSHLKPEYFWRWKFFKTRRVPPMWLALRDWYLKFASRYANENEITVQ